MGRDLDEVQKLLIEIASELLRTFATQTNWDHANLMLSSQDIRLNV